MSFDLHTSLRHSEPFAILASLSFVISAFTTDNSNQSIYNNSVLSGFMFIFAFIFSLISDFIDKTSRGKEFIQSIVFYRLPAVGVYFFMFFGVLYLLLVAIEFGKDQIAIYAYLRALLSFFFLFLGVLYIIKRGQQLKLKKMIVSFDASKIFSDFSIAILMIWACVGAVTSIGEVLYGTSSVGTSVAAFALKYPLKILTPVGLFILVLAISNTRKIVYSQNHAKFNPDGSRRKWFKPSSRVVVANFILVFFIILNILFDYIIILDFMKSLGLIDSRIEDELSPLQIFRNQSQLTSNSSHQNTTNTNASMNASMP